MSSFKDYNNQDVVPTSEAMQKQIAFYHDKDIDMLKLGCFFTKPGRHLLMENYIYSRKEIRTVLEKFEKMLLVVHQSFLHAKQLLMKRLFESLQTYANLLLGLLPDNSIPTQCVNPCLPVIIRVGISIQKRVHSRLDKTTPAVLNTWSCPISNEQDQNV